MVNGWHGLGGDYWGRKVLTNKYLHASRKGLCHLDWLSPSRGAPWTLLMRDKLEQLKGEFLAPQNENLRLRELTPKKIPGPPR